jgi:hypothetical protein
MRKPSRSKIAFPRAKRAWSEGETTKLKQLCEFGDAISDIAHLMGRSEVEVRRKLKQLVQLEGK